MVKSLETKACEEGLKQGGSNSILSWATSGFWCDQAWGAGTGPLLSLGQPVGQLCSLSWDGYGLRAACLTPLV